MDCGYTRLQRLSAAYDWAVTGEKSLESTWRVRTNDMGVHNIKQPFIKADVIQPKDHITV